MVNNFTLFYSTRFSNVCLFLSRFDCVWSESALCIYLQLLVTQIYVFLTLKYLNWCLINHWQFLDWSSINRTQLSWLLPRIPQTRSMSMAGLDFNNCVVALGTCNSPMLQELDLSYVAGLNDVALYKILSAPKDSRPGTQKLKQSTSTLGTQN